MATGYGVDLKAAHEFPDRDVYSRGVENVAYALARRLLTPRGGLADCGDETEYRSLDIRGYMATRLSQSELATIEREATLCCEEEERVASVSVALSFGSGELVAEVEAEAVDGETFRLIVSPSSVTVELLEA